MMAGAYVNGNRQGKVDALTCGLDAGGDLGSDPHPRDNRLASGAS
jgi:hypothetical protein